MEEFCCNGNLIETAINTCFNSTQSNVVFFELKMAEIELGESEEDEEWEGATLTEAEALH